MEKYKSKVDIIYDLLMTDIAKGVYRQDDRLVISQIARQNNVSDIPVREALRRLESEGYVKISANQGATVCAFSIDRLLEIIRIKSVLEGYATRLSIDYVTPALLKKLRILNGQMKKAVDAGNYPKYSELNVKFHMSIYEATPYTELYNMIQDLWRKWSITRSVFAVDPNRMQESTREHEEIIRLLEERQYDQVEQYVRLHKQRTETVFLSRERLDDSRGA